MSMHCNDHVSCLARFVKLSRRKERRTCLEHLITLCVAKLHLKFHRVPYTAPREGVTCFREHSSPNPETQPFSPIL